MEVTKSRRNEESDMEKIFPESFLWGAAASAPQTEGAALIDGKSPSTWDKWYELEPQQFFNQIGPKDTSNTYYLYKEDVRLMKEMGLNSYRTSIAWTRLLPDGQTLNTKAVSFYRNYFTEMLQAGIKPIINLFHFDMPWWLMEKGGWEMREAVDAFAFYAQTAFEQFGDLVKDWTTFNEPMVHIECGYLGEAHYPKVIDFKRAIQVGYHTLMAHVKAVQAFRQVGISKGKIGIILNLSPIYAKSQNPEDQQAQFYADLFYTRSFLDPVVKGEIPLELKNVLQGHGLTPKTKAGDKELIRQYKIDFLGVNYYQPLRVQAPKNQVFPAKSPGYFARGYNWPEKRINPHRGWEIYPAGMYDLAKRIQQEYDNIPWYVSENGMGVEGEEKFTKNQVIQDQYRIAFVKEHLEYLHQAIAEGSHCFGYHMWTFIDCWSWLNGYKNRYGFYQVDLDNQFIRKPKLSSFWFKKISSQNGF